MAARADRVGVIPYPGGGVHRLGESAAQSPDWPEFDLYGIQSATGRFWMVHHSRGAAPAPPAKVRAAAGAKRMHSVRQDRPIGCELVRGVGEFR